MNKNSKIVPEQIMWIDSFTNEADSWKYLEDIEMNTPVMYSFGHVIDKGDYICVIPSLALDDDSCAICGEIYIPKVAIIDRKPL